MFLQFLTGMRQIKKLSLSVVNIQMSVLLLLQTYSHRRFLQAHTSRLSLRGLNYQFSDTRFV